jgi:hypothetical protein
VKQSLFLFVSHVTELHSQLLRDEGGGPGFVRRWVRRARDGCRRHLRWGDKRRMPEQEKESWRWTYLCLPFLAT